MLDYAILSLMPIDRQLKRFPLVAIAALFAGCQGGTEPSAPAEEPANEQAARPPLPIAEPPMDRAALLRAVTEVASQAALGQTDGERQDRLDGKRFEVRIRFGCPTSGLAANPTTAPFGVSFDEEERTLRVRAAPDLGLGDAGVAATAGETVEAVEGFWMHRPWLLQDGCVAMPPPPAAPRADAQRAEPAADTTASKTSTASPPPAYTHRVGIGHFFTESESRTGRRDGRAYESTKVLPEGTRPSAQGYNLVLSGRLRKLPAGRVISCRLTSASLPPECVVSATFDRVRVETPGTNAVLAEWSS